jgi:hypothetical protein
MMCGADLSDLVEEDPGDKKGNPNPDKKSGRDKGKEGP